MATAHIESNLEDIAKTVLMPGDPLRAKYIAETYLTDVKLINTVRNIFGYTGKYKGKEITVFASGIGNPSMGIYSYELYNFYNVENIIRVGTCGAYRKNLNLYDTIIVEGSYSTSNYAKEQGYDSPEIIYSNKELNKKLELAAKNLKIKVKKGIIHCTDAFYKENNNYEELVKKYNILGAEMETFALFSNAKTLNKKATCILTVSDNLVTKQETTSEERQKAFNDMIEIALESTLS
ncbi:MAG: purine-nucleoside phosphorylase [bacterium]|nr:purine-nucleoside phosphorylase [bacterium]